MIYSEVEAVDVILKKRDNLVSSSHQVLKVVDRSSHSQLALNQEEWLEEVLTVLKIPVMAQLPLTMIVLEEGAA